MGKHSRTLVSSDDCGSESEAIESVATEVTFGCLHFSDRKPEQRHFISPLPFQPFLLKGYDPPRRGRGGGRTRLIKSVFVQLVLFVFVDLSAERRGFG